MFKKCLEDRFTEYLEKNYTFIKGLSTNDATIDLVDIIKEKSFKQNNDNFFRFDKTFD